MSPTPPTLAQPNSSCLSTCHHHLAHITGGCIVPHQRICQNPEPQRQGQLTENQAKSLLLHQKPGQDLEPQRNPDQIRNNAQSQYFSPKLAWKPITQSQNMEAGRPKRKKEPRKKMSIQRGKILSLAPRLIIIPNPDATCNHKGTNNNSQAIMSLPEPSHTSKSKYPNTIDAPPQKKPTLKPTL